jgi:hypothetical protein
VFYAIYVRIYEKGYSAVKVIKSRWSAVRAEVGYVNRILRVCLGN